MVPNISSSLGFGRVRGRLQKTIRARPRPGPFGLASPAWPAPSPSSPEDSPEAKFSTSPQACLLSEGPLTYPGLPSSVHTESYLAFALSLRPGPPLP